MYLARRLSMGVALLMLPGQADGQVAPVTDTLPNGIATFSWPGEPGDPVLVLLHGGPGVTHDYLVPEWTTRPEASVRVLYDQRGCGLSVARGPFTWEQHVADLHEVIAATRGNGRVVLAGSSWGAWLGLLYALRYPEDLAGLVLTGLLAWPDSARISYTWDQLSPGALGRIDALNNGQRPSTLQQLTEGEAAAWKASGIDPELVLRFRGFCSDANAATALSFRSMPPVDRLAAINVPVLVFRGDLESKWGDGSQALASVVPHVRVETIPGAGHDPWFSHPDQFFKLLNEFTEALTP